MAFNIRHFLRQISAELLLAFLEARNPELPAQWRELDDQKLAKQVADEILDGRLSASEPMLADLVRLDPMATERGRIALLNVAQDDPTVAVQFGDLKNDSERALWMLMSHPQRFREGEELRFFDYYSERRRGQHFRTRPNVAVSRAPDDVSAFRSEICQFYRKRDGSGVSCHVEFNDRRQEGAVQVSLYVQGLPSHANEFVDGAFQRRVSHPTIDAAIVYDPIEGHTATVARGGAPVHTALREAFARKLLKIEPRFDVIEHRRFQLQALKTPLALEANPALGIRAVRVRKLTMAHINPAAGFLVLEAPAGQPDTTVYTLANRWFGQATRVFDQFNVVQATISMHFERLPDAKRPKTINLELSRNGSNLHDLSPADRQVAESHIEKWQLIEPQR